MPAAHPAAGGGSTSAAQATRLPQPVPGSPRYFALLYTARERRWALATLLALADEIAAGSVRQLDPQVARLRLEWWRLEAQRFARAAATHPWLIDWQRAAGAPADLDLEALVEAAAVDRLSRERFVLAARVLGAAAGAEQQQRLRALGAWVGELEVTTMQGATTALQAGTAGPEALTASAAARELLDATAGQLIEPALQPAVAPLLVWLAVAARQRRAQRSLQQRLPADANRRLRPPSRFAGFADNLVAWRSARRAARGGFRLRSDGRLETHD